MTVILGTCAIQNKIKSGASKRLVNKIKRHASKVRFTYNFRKMADLSKKVKIWSEKINSKLQ